MVLVFHADSVLSKSDSRLTHSYTTVPPVLLPTDCPFLPTLATAHKPDSRYLAFLSLCEDEHKWASVVNSALGLHETQAFADE
jgi:hypothetical protein